MLCTTAVNTSMRISDEASSMQFTASFWLAALATAGNFWLKGLWKSALLSASCYVNADVRQLAAVKIRWLQTNNGKQ